MVEGRLRQWRRKTCESVLESTSEILSGIELEVNCVGGVGIRYIMFLMNRKSAYLPSPHKQCSKSQCHLQRDDGVGLDHLKIKTQLRITS